MSAKNTTSLGFPQWASEEKPERSDFNDAFLLMDSIIREQDEKIVALEVQIQELQKYAIQIPGCDWPVTADGHYPNGEITKIPREDCGGKEELSMCSKEQKKSSKSN